MAAAPMRKAGELLNWLLTDQTGEEVGEGVLGGLMAGGAMLGTDQPLEQTALQTLTAMGGGIALGMAGRRIGANLGRRIKPDALKDQNGVIANLSRIAGSETTAQGMGNQAVMMKEGIQEALIQRNAARLANEAAMDPKAFAARYGISADQFESGLPGAQPLRAASLLAQNLEKLSPEDRVAYLKHIGSTMPGLEDALRASDVLSKHTATHLDESIQEMADGLRSKGGMEGVFKKATEKFTEMDAGETVTPEARQAREAVMSYLQGMTKGVTPETLEALLNPAPPVTGVHVGRALGRAIGDEVGVISGLMGGNMLAQAFGIGKESEVKPQGS